MRFEGMVAMQTTKLGKERNPLVVVLLSFITLGIYFAYWYYKVNREVVEYDEGIHTDPILSLLAITIGALLIIPPYISAFNTAARVRQMFSDNHAPISISPGAALGLYFLIAVGYPILQLFYPAYLQSKLNRFWRQQAAAIKAEAEQRPAA